MQPIHTAPFLDFDQICQKALKFYRQEIIEGNATDIPGLFQVLVNSDLSIPRFLGQDPPLYSQIINLMGLSWLPCAVEISVKSQLQKRNYSEVWLERRFSLLKEDLEDGDSNLHDHLESFLTLTKANGLKKILADPDFIRLFSQNQVFWSNSLCSQFPDCVQLVNAALKEDRSGIKTPFLKRQARISDKEKMLAQLRMEIQVNPADYTVSIIRFLEKNGQGRLWDIFLDPELSERLLQDTEYPWVGPILQAFKENHTVIERFLSREWSTRVDFSEYLKTHHKWVDELSEFFDPMTPFLFLFYFIKKDYDPINPSIDSEAFHKLFLDPNYLEFFHQDEGYTWIPFYLSRFRKNGMYINSFLSDRLFHDRKLKRLVDQNPPWIRSLMDSVPTVTPFTFTVMLLQNKLNYEEFTPDDFAFNLDKLPCWVSEVFVNPNPCSPSKDTFFSFLNFWGHFFESETFVLKDVQEFMWFLPNLHPIEMVFLARDARFRYMMAKTLPNFPTKAKAIMIPSLNTTGLWTLMREMPLEQHPIFLSYATTRQKEFYGSMQIFHADYELENLASNFEKRGLFLKKRIAVLEQIKKLEVSTKLLNHHLLRMKQEAKKMGWWIPKPNESTLTLGADTH